jgi:amino acid adenylation domain-containing protein
MLQRIDENLLLSQGKYLKEKNYWLQKLSFDMPETYLNEINNFRQNEFKREIYKIRFNAELCKKLIKLSNNTALALYLILLSGLKVLLYRYSGNRHITVGSPVLKQNCSDDTLNEQVAIYDEVDGDSTFKELLLKVRQSALEAYENQNYPFHRISKALNLFLGETDSPRFNIMCCMENIHDKSIIEAGRSDLVFSFELSGGVIEGCILYNTYAFASNVIEQYAGHYINILGSVLEIENLNICIKDAELLTDMEKKLVVEDFNNTTAEYQKHMTIQEMFRLRASEMLNSTALVFNGTQMTYGELDARSDSLAGILGDKGIKAGSIVGIIARRSLEMMVGILGILKAGGAYLPIDPEYPEERVNYMIGDSGAELLLTYGAEAGRNVFPGEIIDLKDPKLYNNDNYEIGIANSPEDPAYVIYTSGSTGKPKGVMIRHRNVVNFIEGVCSRIEFARNSTILALTTLSFDIFVLETLLPLIKGQKIVIADEECQRDSKLLSRLIMDNKIDMVQTTPSRIQLLMTGGGDRECFNVVKKIMIGGEAISPRLLADLSSVSNARIYNMYGPTETTVWSTIKELTGQKDITIGKPISNTRIYILDKNQRVLPVGVAGQLFIAGDGVGIGYLGRAELTDEKFIPNPFVKGERMYCTGDLARWLSNGEIEYIGRDDFQLKLRGYRVELGEIEEAVRNIDGISDCVVVAKDNNAGDKYLVGYYTSTREIAKSEIAGSLERKLPEYMVPGIYIRLDKIPLLPNGKTNRKELPEPDRTALSSEFEEAGTDAEKKLVEVWQEVLNRDVIGIHDNFFELGGNSLRLVMLHAKIEEIYPGKVKIADLFTYSTIGKLIRYIEETSEEESSVLNIEKLEFPGDYFLEDGRQEEGTVFHVKFEEQECARLQKVQQTKGIAPVDILTACFIYLLSDISEKQIISVQTLSADSKKVRPLRVNMDSCSSLPDLFEKIKLERSSFSEKPGNSLSAFNRISIEKGHNEIIPLFCFGGIHPNIPQSTFDLIIKIFVNGLVMELSCEYNIARLNREKIEGAVSGYVKLISIILGKTYFDNDGGD